MATRLEERCRFAANLLVPHRGLQSSILGHVVEVIPPMYWVELMLLKGGIIRPDGRLSIADLRGNWRLLLWGVWGGEKWTSLI